MSGFEIIKSEVEKLLKGKDSAVLDMGEYRVLITIIDGADEYDLDADLESPEIAAIVAEGYDDYRAGRVVDHEEVVRRLKG
ncbi:MAG: hypothetical protein VR68_16600 [Peptococcaceae bacterium BRH_c4a]|nr:MAG: hypothetical protein VR68_16600 [Peptococcaceae bacterium BRH_c4a]